MDLQGREGLSNLPQVIRMQGRGTAHPQGSPGVMSILFFPPHTAPDVPAICRMLEVLPLLELSLAGKVFSGSPRALWSLKSERAVGGHFLVAVFNHQVHAAALGAMPTFPGVVPGVQTLTQISLYCISVFP